MRRPSSFRPLALLPLFGAACAVLLSMGHAEARRGVRVPVVKSGTSGAGDGAKEDKPAAPERVIGPVYTYDPNRHAAAAAPVPAKVTQPSPDGVEPPMLGQAALARKQPARGFEPLN